MASRHFSTVLEGSFNHQSLLPQNNHRSLIPQCIFSKQITLSGEYGWQLDGGLPSTASSTGTVSEPVPAIFTLTLIADHANKRRYS